MYPYCISLKLKILTKKRPRLRRLHQSEAAPTSVSTWMDDRLFPTQRLHSEK